MTDGLSAADVALLSGRNNDGWGGDWMGMIALFFLFSMMGWGGYGGFGNGFGERNATVGDVQRGFDTQAIISKLDGINSGLCDGFYAQNSTMLNISNNLQRDLCTGFAGTNAAVQQARFDAQQCCCDTQKEIIQNRYEAAQNASAIMQNSDKGVQRILDYLCNQENQNLRDENMRNYINSMFCGVPRFQPGTVYGSIPVNPFFGYGNDCGRCCGNGNI